MESYDSTNTCNCVSASLFPCIMGIMRKLFVLTAIVLLSPILAHAQYAEIEGEKADYDMVSAKESHDDLWKYKRKLMLGFTTGELDQKIRFGGKITSRWGVSLVSGRNIYLHSRAIGGFLKFGINLDLNFNYMNFAKGSGKLSGIWNTEESDDAPTLGRHYVTGGLAIGPTATFAPFYASDNRNLAQLKFRPYFHVVPSYAAYLVSDDEDTEVHGAFACWCAAGLEAQWKRLIVGFEWKGCTAKYKGLVDNIIADSTEGYDSQGSYKFDTNMFNIMLGFAF